MKILDLRNGELFQLRSQPDTVYVRRKPILDGDNKYTGVVIQAVLKRLDGEWQLVRAVTETCNHCASVRRVKIEIVSAPLPGRKGSTEGPHYQRGSRHEAEQEGSRVPGRQVED